MLDRLTGTALILNFFWLRARMNIALRQKGPSPTFLRAFFALLRQWAAGWVFLLIWKVGKQRAVATYVIVDASPGSDLEPFFGHLRYALQFLEEHDRRWAIWLSARAPRIIVGGGGPDRVLLSQKLVVLSRVAVENLRGDRLACLLVYYAARARLRAAVHPWRVNEQRIDCAARRAELRFARRAPVQAGWVNQLEVALREHACTGK
jgi:hypothetical protein